MNSGRVWVASEVYYPDEQATGVFMTRIAEGLAARGFNVHALTAQPHGERVASRETHNGVKILRCWSTRFSKDFLPGRMLNVFTVSISMLCSAIRHIGKGDLVLAVTSPPTLPFMIIVACKLKGAKCVVRIDDVFPNALHNTGVLSNQTFLYRMFDRLMGWLLDRADVIVVIGRDMRDLIASKTTIEKEIRVITNWADIDQISPDAEAGQQFLQKYGLADKLVLQWAGNMGFPHDIETLLEAMEKLADHEEAHFLYIGAGAKRPWLEEQVEKKGLKNVTFVGLLPRSDQQAFLNGCSIGLSALVEGMTGVWVPSRSYNILCAGKPILAISEPEGEIARLLVDKDVGWVIDQGDSDHIVSIVKELLQDRSILDDISLRAREVVEEEYSSAYVIDRYAELVEEYLQAQASNLVSN